MSESRATVLIVDDDQAVATVLGALVRQAGFAAEMVASGAAALEALALRPFDLVISDMRMPGMDGMQLLAQVAQRLPELPFILVTAHGTVPLAVEAMKAGATDFVLKPFDRDEILFAMRKALASAPQGEAPEPASAMGGALVGDSPALRQTLQRLARAAEGDATVLLRGESGTGKELMARALHDQGRRRKGPFIKVHCAALPDNLLESELFGYEKGAFTGAACRKPGRVELAEGGTLFLDEIGDITPAVQVKLLRLLQDRAFERLGGIASIAANVRFVAATHRDLEPMVAKGEFREDLFYRLNVVPIFIPPLRERPGDVERLAGHFCAVLGASHRGKPVALEPTALALLQAQPWPGNVRQLQNLIERLIVLGDGETLRADDVERELGRPRLAPAGEPSLDSRRRSAEREALQDALGRANGNRTVAARLLGVSRRTLYNKLAEHQLI
jgi:DNA-binding NtrC family response regulator